MPRPRPDSGLFTVRSGRIGAGGIIHCVWMEARGVVELALRNGAEPDCLVRSISSLGLWARQEETVL